MIALSVSSEAENAGMIWRRRGVDASVEVIFSWASVKVTMLTFSNFLYLGSRKLFSESESCGSF